MNVEVSTQLPADDAWDDLVDRSGAPLFYRARVLRAYQHRPLLPGVDPLYLVVRDEEDSGRLAAAVPVFLTPPLDPLGSLAPLHPGYLADGRPLLLSHFWHWYDTHLLSGSPATGPVHRVVDALDELRLATGAQGCGFVNVAVGSPSGSLLAAHGLRGRAVHARYQLPLDGFGRLEDYLLQLRPRVRQDVRRQLRAAQRAGAVVALEQLSYADIDRVSALCQLSAAKHDNAGWYEPSRLGPLLAALRDDVQLVTVRQQGRIVAASVSFADGSRFHNWAAGSEPPASLPFSPYLVLLTGTISAAIAAGCRLIEGGRSNEEWKLRLGMRRVDLWGWLRTDSGDASVGAPG